MSEAKLTFKREGREGIIPVGTYLSDAAKRLGVLFEEKCVPAESVHFCKVTVVEGENALTPPTAHESQYFTDSPADTSERLSCQTKITEAEEIVIMTAEKKEEEKAADEKPKISAEEYAKEFRELPLEKKVAELVQLEAIALGETMSFIMNSPYLIFGKVMDVMAEFGLKKEEQGKMASRPAEHVAEDAVKGEADDASEKDEAEKDEAVPASEPTSESKASDE